MVPVRLSSQDGHVGQPEKCGDDVKSGRGGLEVVPHIEHADIVIGHSGADVAEAGAQHVHEAVLAAQRLVQQDGQRDGHVEEDDGRGQEHAEQKHQHIAEAVKGHHKRQTTAAVTHRCGGHVCARVCLDHCTAQTGSRAAEGVLVCSDLCERMNSPCITSRQVPDKNTQRSKKQLIITPASSRGLVYCCSFCFLSSFQYKVLIILSLRQQSSKKKKKMMSLLLNTY